MLISNSSCACANERSSGFRDTRQFIGVRVLREFSHGQGILHFKNVYTPFLLCCDHCVKTVEVEV